MTPEESVNKFILDKPLNQLTEDDISQLTREDCRRYLKAKGMRRPSWNKSQAIQQVICLKALLEPASDSYAGAARKKLYIPRPQIPPTRVHRGTSEDTEISASAEETVPSLQKDPSFELDNLEAGLVAAENESTFPRTTGVASMSLEQMTIFYCGKVNVYDDVPVDKAQAIMQLAASPLHFPQETSQDGYASIQSLPCHLRGASIKVGSSSSISLLPTSQTAEGSSSRKASLQRYLDKRKDRFRSKRKVGTTCATSDIYINHQIANWVPNEFSGNASSLAPIKSPSIPNHRSSLEDNVVKSANHSAVIDDRGLS